MEEFAFQGSKRGKKEQWMSDWLDEWEAGWSWEEPWLRGASEVNSASSRGDEKRKGGKRIELFKEEDPLRLRGGISQDDLLDRRERRRERGEMQEGKVPFASIKNLQRRRSTQKVLICTTCGWACWFKFLLPVKWTHLSLPFKKQFRRAYCILRWRRGEKNYFFSRFCFIIILFSLF